MIALDQLPLADEVHDQAFLDFWIQDFGACTLSAADEVGIFVALAQSGQTAPQIADLLRLDPESTQAVCRALVSLHALTVHDDVFELTPFSRAFWIKRTPTYRGREFDRHRDWEQHQRIVDTLESKWAPLHAGDESFTASWRKGTLSADSAIAFTRVMHSMILMPSLAAVRSDALSDLRHLVDVGGGSGALCAALAAHQPDTRVTVMDLQPVCDASKKILDGVRSGSRVAHFPCNFFDDPWPVDADGFLFSNILHDWPVKTCRTLLALAFDALEPSGRVYVHEALLEPDRCSPRMTCLFNLLMHMNHRGQQFTQQDLFELLEDAGFQSPRVVHAYSYWRLVEAKKPA
jgi:hypothetical protein